ncbi:hypothetical protein PS2_006977 [Malus domestica]
MGFDNRWIRLVMLCVTMVSFFVVINGKLGPYFYPTRGLKQRDPLSPYLFLLEYCLASGKSINYDKSSIFLSPNTPFLLANQVCTILKISASINPGKYLGLPLIWGKSKRDVLVYVKDRILNKIQGWKASSLTMAGREVLLKSVALAIPTYPMTCFKFPTATCNSINGDLGRFWWGESEKGNRIHWKSSKYLCGTKKEGEMGIGTLKTLTSLFYARGEIWKERCFALFDDKSPKPAVLSCIAFPIWYQTSVTSIIVVSHMQIMQYRELFLGGASLHSHRSSTDAAEAEAILGGLKFSKAKCFNHNIIKSNSSKVIDLELGSKNGQPSSSYGYMLSNLSWATLPPPSLRWEVEEKRDKEERAQNVLEIFICL